MFFLYLPTDALIQKMGKKSSGAEPFKPDQGWAWLILLAGFCCNVTFDGIIFSFGIFYMEFLDYFGQGRGLTSWIGSVISGVYALVGRCIGAWCMARSVKQSERQEVSKPKSL